MFCFVGAPSQNSPGNCHEWYRRIFAVRDHSQTRQPRWHRRTNPSQKTKTRRMRLRQLPINLLSNALVVSLSLPCPPPPPSRNPLFKLLFHHLLVMYVIEFSEKRLCELHVLSPGHRCSRTQWHTSSWISLTKARCCLFYPYWTLTAVNLTHFIFSLTSVKIRLVKARINIFSF